MQSRLGFLLVNEQLGDAAMLREYVWLVDVYLPELEVEPASELMSSRVET